MQKNGILYVVPTPIGNLEDITLRALRLLKEVDLVVCEDTRRTKILLEKYDIKKPLLSYYLGKEKQRLHKIIAVLKDGKDVALVSDAGTPAISDPGYILINECIKQDIKIVVLPGATAVIPAVVLSGFAEEGFCFLGFLPNKSAKRKKKLLEFKEVALPLVFYLSPHRLKQELLDILDVLGDRSFLLARELTKVYESIYRACVSDILSLIEKGVIPQKGEFVGVIEGYKGASTKMFYTEERLLRLVYKMLEKGLTKKDVLNMLSYSFDINKSRLKQILTEDDLN